MTKINPDNLFGTAGHTNGIPDVRALDSSRKSFVNRPAKGKTRRKRIFASLIPRKPTNIGDPMKGQSANGKRK